MPVAMSSCSRAALRNIRTFSGLRVDLQPGGSPGAFGGGGVFFTGSAIFTIAVNNAGLVKIEGARFEAEALRILRAIPGLTVVSHPAKRDRGADALVWSGNKRTRIGVECRLRANAAVAWELVHQAESHRKIPLLLIAGETTEQARAILREHGIAVVDGLGNAHIQLPGLLFHLEGRRKLRGSPAPTRLRGKAGLVAQALLLHPDRAWQVAELTEQAHVSAGLAHRVLARLEAEGILTSEGAGPKRVRRVVRATALLDLWAEENLDRPTRTLAHLLAQNPRQLMADLGANLGRRGLQYALTGAAAGSLIAPFITAVPVVELWVPSTASPEQLHEATGAAPVADGHNVVFLQAKDDVPLAFREHVGELQVVNRFRLYSDLRNDPRRGREQAKHLRQQVIGF
jgi:hypothetical protein